jgi:hypothetical protein
MTGKGTPETEPIINPLNKDLFFVANQKRFLTFIDTHMHTYLSAGRKNIFT